VGSVSFGAENIFTPSNGTVNLAVGDIDGMENQILQLLL
jgi:hypothetical protein